MRETLSAGMAHLAFAALLVLSAAVMVYVKSGPPQQAELKQLQTSGIH